MQLKKVWRVLYNGTEGLIVEEILTAVPHNVVLSQVGLQRSGSDGGLYLCDIFSRIDFVVDCDFDK
jgi:hypothetical protein